MSDFLSQVMDASPPPFPSTLAAAREFIRRKGLHGERVDDAMLERIVTGIAGGRTLSHEEIAVMHQVTDLGDTCGCDSDHRIRGAAQDGKRIGYSRT
jgi:hypothetical protein